MRAVLTLLLAASPCSAQAWRLSAPPCTPSRNTILIKEQQRREKLQRDFAWSQRQYVRLLKSKPGEVERLLRESPVKSLVHAALRAAGERRLGLHEEYRRLAEDEDGFVRQAAMYALRTDPPYRPPYP